MSPAISESEAPFSQVTTTASIYPANKGLMFEFLYQELCRIQFKEVDVFIGWNENKGWPKSMFVYCIILCSNNLTKFQFHIMNGIACAFAW